jgi:hypothetical protein
MFYGVVTEWRKLFEIRLSTFHGCRNMPCMPRVILLPTGFHALSYEPHEAISVRTHFQSLPPEEKQKYLAGQPFGEEKTGNGYYVLLAPGVSLKEAQALADKINLATE